MILKQIKYPVINSKIFILFNISYQSYAHTKVILIHINNGVHNNGEMHIPVILNGHTFAYVGLHICRILQNCERIHFYLKSVVSIK